MNNYADTDVRPFSDDEVIELQQRADDLVTEIYNETGRTYDAEVGVEDEYSYIVMMSDWNVADKDRPIVWTYPDLDTAERELKIIAGYPV